MSILNSRGISFSNRVVAGKIVKATNGSDPDMGLISTYNSSATMERIIGDLDKAIAGQFDLIADPDVGTDAGGLAFITPNGVEFYDDEGVNILPPSCPLIEFRELLTAWKAFYETPPLNGSAV